MKSNAQDFQKMLFFFLVFFAICGILISLFIHVYDRLLFSVLHTVLVPLGSSVFLGAISFFLLRHIFTSQAKKTKKPSPKYGQDYNLLLDFSRGHKSKENLKVPNLSALQESMTNHDAVNDQMQANVPTSSVSEDAPKIDIPPLSPARGKNSDVLLKKRLGQMETKGDIGTEEKEIQSVPTKKMVGVIREVMNTESV